MFEDPELPDFDSMSQEELIKWLEELTKLQGAVSSDFTDDAAGEGDDYAEDEADQADETWAAWLDDTRSASAPPTEGDLTVGDNFADEDEETPLDLARFDHRDRGPLDADAMAWLAEINAAESEEELPEITDYRAPAPPPENLDELLAQGAREEPLEWLDSLSGRNAGPRLPLASHSEPAKAHEDAAFDADAGADFDDAYEDDETLDDLDDESLYTRRPDNSAAVLDSIMGMTDRESEEYSTQSMAPVPENAEPAEKAESSAAPAEALAAEPEATAPSADGLSHALMLGERPVDLETWYINRLREIAAGEAGLPQPAATPAPAPVAPPAKPPPPGLAAAIYSARGKVEANELRAALADYETLLRTSAGLEWVIGDMRGLIAQDKYRRNPSVHRVLGDAFMRQGQLDAALDVYRHALTLL